MAPVTLTPDGLRVLLQQTRETFAIYLRCRAALRAQGVTDAAFAILEAEEHVAWDLVDGVPDPPTPAFVPRWAGVDVSGNLITGP